MKAAHCVHCGRIWVQTEEEGSDFCSCGAEVYPIIRKITPGEFKLSDGYEARVVLEDKIEENVENKLDKILRQLIRGVIKMAKANGWDKTDFTVMLHDLWGEDS